MPQNTENASKNYWLVKFAPFRTSWSDIVSTGRFTLRGVRSPAARKNLIFMKVDDLVLFYQSQENQAIVGLMKVTRETYPDPASASPQWLTCDFSPLRTLPKPISLAQIKMNPIMQSLALIKQPRLAVMSVSEDQFHCIAG